MITHSCPYINNDILTEIEKVLDSKMIGQGGIVKIFEDKITDYIGGYKTACVGSGTIALLLALKLLDLAREDEVVLPTLVCRNVLEAVVESGATAVLCDVGENWVVTYDTIKPAITIKTKAIIVPHLYGIKADIKEIKKLGIPVIEDCAQAFGRTVNGKKIGIEGDLSIFSFHPTKCLTTGEGGAIMLNANSKSLAKALFKNRDGDKELTRRIFAPMSNISAAMGLAQLRKYDYFLKKRFRIARRYDDILKKKKEAKILDSKAIPTMYFRYLVKTKKRFLFYSKKFEDLGVVVRRGVDLLLHRALNLDKKRFINSEYLFEHTLSIPIYPALNNKQINCICNAMDDIFV